MKEKKYAMNKENIFEATLVYATLVDDGRIDVIDSRVARQEICDIAEDFEKMYRDEEWEDKDYLDTIMEYAEKRLIEKFGVEDGGAKNASAKEVATEPETMTVETPMGTIKAYKSNVQNHPGIYVDLSVAGEIFPLNMVEYIDDAGYFEGGEPFIVTRIWRAVYCHKDLERCFP